MCVTKYAFADTSPPECLSPRPYGVPLWTVVDLLRQAQSHPMVTQGVVESYVALVLISMLCRFHLALKPFIEVILCNILYLFILSILLS